MAGGQNLTVGGMLTNSSNVQLGNNGLSAATGVTAQGLTNTGTIGRMAEARARRC